MRMEWDLKLGFGRMMMAEKEINGDMWSVGSCLGKFEWYEDIEEWRGERREKWRMMEGEEREDGGMGWGIGSKRP